MKPKAFSKQIDATLLPCSAINHQRHGSRSIRQPDDTKQKDNRKADEERCSFFHSRVRFSPEDFTAVTTMGVN
jgi:hypothetical protein